MPYHSVYEFTQTSITTNTTQRGFSLVELLVVIGIFVVISTIGLVSYGQFSGQTLLNSLAYEVALSIREAQSLAISVTESGAGGGNFSTGYGVYFDSGSPNSYILFSDIDGDGVYDGDSSCGEGGPSECIELFVVGGRYGISNLCATLPSGITQCSSDASSPLTNISIVFERPEPDALMASNIGGEIYGEVQITIRSSNDYERTISVVSTGQISVIPVDL